MPLWGLAVRLLLSRHELQVKTSLMEMGESCPGQLRFTKRSCADEKAARKCNAGKRLKRNPSVRREPSAGTAAAVLIAPVLSGLLLEASAGAKPT